MATVSIRVNGQSYLVLSDIDIADRANLAIGRRSIDKTHGKQKVMYKQSSLDESSYTG